MFEVFAKLDQFPDGERILREIETAYAELRKNKAVIAKMMQEENCWQNVLDQLRYIRFTTFSALGGTLFNW